MDTRKAFILLAILLVFLSVETGTVQGQGSGKDPANKYDVKKPLPGTEQVRAVCKTKGACFNTTLTCPAQCPDRKPKKNTKDKGCFINCSSKCEATCKSKYIFFISLYL